MIMKIFVCVKQVPDTSGKVAVNENGTLDRGSMSVITNPDDMNAMEAALTLKDENGGQVIAVTMGPPRAEEMLRELLAMGADQAILVSSREFGGSDTFATSQIIAAAINHAGFGGEDIILCGRQAIDGDTAQVGPQIAEKLDIPQVTYAAQIVKEEGLLKVKRMMEDGYVMVEIKTPCLITCIRELNSPRYMSLKGITECYEKPITVMDFEELRNEPLIELDTIGLKGSPTNIYKSFTPPGKGSGVLLVGGAKEAARELADRLQKAHMI